MAISPLPAPLPTTIERTGNNGLQIAWSDGEVREYRAADLRDQCPCATCREKRSAKPVEKPDGLLELNVLSPAEAETISQGGVSVAGMRPVGAYAYHIDFSDGHNTGLFTFDLLRELGETVAP